MDLQSLHIFLLCTRYLSFSKVAELTYSSQSSVSKSIAALEAEVGGELFRRSSRKMELTDLGEKLLPYVQALLSKEEELRGFLHQFHAGETVRPLVIGIAKFLTDTPMEELLFPLTSAIDQFYSTHGDSDVKVAYFDENELQNLLASKRVDLAITAVNNSHLRKTLAPGMDFIRLNEVDNYLLFQADEGETPTLEDALAKMDCLLSVKDQIAVSISYDFLRKLRVPLRVETCDNWSEVVVKVKNGQGGTILGAATARPAIRCGLMGLSLKDYDLTSSLIAIWNHETAAPCVEEAAVLLRSAFSETMH